MEGGVGLRERSKVEVGGTQEHGGGELQNDFDMTLLRVQTKGRTKHGAAAETT